ncbi:hypothetical protein CHH55_03760 [Niallia circulans]|jgi:hypothetical protein|uniref:Uncharacterized protein n=1 Tax=Niallia circulans TaxID=1397 RepID=A0A0J1IFS7_NIACI|nr:hypothetical protein [Niallia circulans]KLV24811.1 hypothetical protein ABW02_17335 [Niallia circulans]MCM2980225.1 hypothetical protein [Niallia circulans]MDR4315151.1 hypothetical protein [Niallia circulans]MED3839884.1 hypothetical protein [Niallia circulans]MED4241370.1 hypothetical protein [Niallia circulans]
MSTLYEKIIEVLQQKGPTTLSAIFNELNSYLGEEDTPISMSSIKSVLSRKKDLFEVYDDIVSIHPAKEITKLIVEYKVNQEHSFSIHIDFDLRNYLIQEWSQFPIVIPPVFNKIEPEEFDALRMELYRLKMWDWEEELLGIETVKCTARLVTVTTTYTVDLVNMQSKEWRQLQKMISLFTDLELLLK